MGILHETFDFNATLSFIDKVLVPDGEPIKKFSRVPEQEEIGELECFISTYSIVYVKLRVNAKSDTTKSGQTVSFIQRECFYQIVTKVLQEHPSCVDFMIHDDDVVCIVDTPNKPDINLLFDELAKVNSMLSILNQKSEQAGLSPLLWGIGAHYGDSYVSVQHYHEGQPRLTWDGYTYNYALFLCEKALDNNERPIVTSKTFFDNLKNEYKQMMLEEKDNIYSANVINRTITELWTSKPKI